MGVRHVFSELMLIPVAAAINHEAPMSGEFWLRHAGDCHLTDSLLALLAVAASALGVGVTCWVVLCRRRL